MLHHSKKCYIYTLSTMLCAHAVLHALLYIILYYIILYYIILYYIVI